MNQFNKRKITKKYFSFNNSKYHKKSPMNIHNKNKEIVYQLNFKNDDLENVDNESIKITKSINKNDSKEEINPNELYTSMAKIKTFLPDINKFLETAKNERIEKIIYRRLKNQEIENALKKKIKEIVAEKDILSKKMNEYIVDLHKKENEIAEKLVSINVMEEINLNLTFNKLNSNIDKGLELDNKNSSNELEINKNEKDLKNGEINMNKYKKMDNIDKMEIINLKSKRNIKFQDLKLKLKDLKNEKKKILKKINDLEYKKEILRIKKNSLTQELYIHYLEILKNGKDTRSEGLSWAIREIFLLNKKVLLSYLPEFLDHFGKIFLFNQAKNKIELEEINKKLKSIKQDLFDKGFLGDSNNNNFKKKEKRENLNKSETENSIILNNISKDNSQYENKKAKNSILMENKNIINNNMNLKPTFNSNKKFEIKINKSPQNKKNNNIRNLYNTNYHNFLEKYNTTILDLNDSGNANLKSHKEHDFFNNCRTADSTAYSTKYNNLNIKSKEKENYSSYYKIPKVIKLNELEKYINQKKSESKIRNSNISNLIEQFQKLSKKQKSLKKKLDEMKKNEMDRIFNEYLRNNYYQKYKVEKNVVLSALIGEDNINGELNKQIKRAKKYFEDAKSYSLGHKKLNKKLFRFDKDNQAQLKTIIGDTFMGGLY